MFKIPMSQYSGQQCGLFKVFKKINGQFLTYLMLQIIPEEGMCGDCLRGILGFFLLLI
ncbi:hypothetical protein J6TS2_12600 [Heyndrickxia sporothermodurans]|nr:hypothetical protein J6TS2_12600 [Heyndrickxia sporothermodurans]